MLLTVRYKAVVPVLFLILCSFVVYTTGAWYFSAFCPRFSVCFSILITSLGEKGAGLCASRTFDCLFLRVYVFVLFLFLLV